MAGIHRKGREARKVHKLQIDKLNEPIASGLNVSPGAAVGVVAFDADTAERWAKEEDG